MKLMLNLKKSEEIFSEYARILRETGNYAPILVALNELIFEYREILNIVDKDKLFIPFMCILIPRWYTFILEWYNSLRKWEKRQKCKRKLKRMVPRLREFQKTLSQAKGCDYDTLFKDNPVKGEDFLFADAVSQLLVATIECRIRNSLFDL